MAVKYHCRKCGKRFLDWGAEKLGYKCPDCEGEDLIRVGSPDDKAVKRPALKRKPRPRVVAVPLEEEELTIDELDAEPLEEEVIYAEEEVEEEAEFLEPEAEAVVEADDEELVEAEAEFGTVTPAIAEDIDEVLPETEDEWPA
jgi:predicted  nucleic acid-binding Zn-ribbon protein